MSYSQLARYTPGYNNTPQGFFQSGIGQQYANSANPWTGQVSNLQNAMGGFNPQDMSKNAGIWATYGGYKAPDINDPATIASMGNYRNMFQGDINRNLANANIIQKSTRGSLGGGANSAEGNAALGFARGIADQTTGLNQAALDYLTNKNKWDYSLQRNMMSDWLAGQNAINSALQQQTNYDINKMKTLYGAYNDTPGAIMRAAQYSDNANNAVNQANQQQAQYQQQVNNNEMWKNAVYGNAVGGTTAALLPQSNLYYSYLMGQPTRRG